MMDKALLDTLNQSITVNAYASKNDANEFTYAVGSSSVDCRIQQEIKVIIDEFGREAVSSCQIYVDGTSTITKNDKITLPDSTIPQILAIYSTPDELGVNYYRCIYT